MVGTRLRTLFEQFLQVFEPALVDAGHRLHRCLVVKLARRFIVGPAAIEGAFPGDQIAAFVVGLDAEPGGAVGDR